MFFSELEDQMLIKYKISEDDFNILEEVVQLQQPYKAGKPWKFAGSFYYATTVLTTIGTYALDTIEDLNFSFRIKT